jgi:hypothetical protein
MNSIVVTIAPEVDWLRILATQDGRDVLQAVLGCPSQSHPRAVSTLLEGLALWYQSRLSVVLCVDERDGMCGTQSLVDEVGFGRQGLHYDVGLAVRNRRTRRSFRGVGRFQDLRHLTIQQVVR